MHATLNVQSAATLCHEMMRLGSDCDVIVIDIAGHDSAIARRAIALADTLVTPVNNSFADLDWVVVGNRVRRETSRNQQSITAALERIAPKANFSIGTGLSERTAYRELFLWD